MTPEQRATIERYYEVHRDGTVISKMGQYAGRALTMRPGNKDIWKYPSYTLTIQRPPLPEVRYTAPVHVLLAHWFIPNPENKLTVNHINGDKTDFSLSNLEWATHSENAQHAFKTGLRSNLGEAHSRAKLTEAQVKEICANYKQGMGRKEWLKINDGKASEAILENIFYGYQWVHISSLYGIIPKVSRVSVKI